jgi:SHS2 domain-containing protein
MGVKFEIIDHTGDVGIRVHGESLSGLFQNAAEAFFAILMERKTIRKRRSQRISLQASGIDELLVAWLNEFLFLFDARGMLFSGFDIESLDEQHLEATVHGEGYDKERHEINTLIKAVTYHQLYVRPEKEGWRAQIIFDL